MGTEKLVRFRSRFVNSLEPNFYFVLGSLIFYLNWPSGASLLVHKRHKYILCVPL